MIKDKNSSTNNVFKTIVRDVVREELKPATEKIVNTLRTELKTELNNTKREILTTVNELVDEKIDNSYRKYRDDVLTGLDKVMGELKTIRQEQTMHQGQHDDLNMLPERMADIEKIHPQGKHAVI